MVRHPGGPLDDLGDALGPQLGSALCAVDPSEIGTPVELSQPVEERSGTGIGVEGRLHVGGEVVTLGAFGGEHDRDGVAGS